MLSSVISGYITISCLLSLSTFVRAVDKNLTMCIVQDTTSSPYSRSDAEVRL
eukprot:Awhi_evm1s6477